MMVSIAGTSPLSTLHTLLFLCVNFGAIFYSAQHVVSLHVSHRLFVGFRKLLTWSVQMLDALLDLDYLDPWLVYQDLYAWLVFIYYLLDDLLTNWLLYTTYWMTCSLSWLLYTTYWMTCSLSWLWYTTYWMTCSFSWLLYTTYWMTCSLSWLLYTTYWMTCSLSWLLYTIY